MFHYRINQYQAVALRIEREILVFQRTAVQTNQTTLLAKYRSELIHDTAVHTAIVVLGRLTYLSQLELVNLVVTEQIVQCVGISALQGCGRGHTCSQRNVTGKSGIETFDLNATLDHLTANTEDITCPAGAGSILFVQAKLYIVLQVDGICLYCIGTVGLDFGNHTFIYRTGEYETTVVVGVFTDEVNTSGRSINSSSCSVKVFNETASYVIYIHDINNL